MANLKIDKIIEGMRIDDVWDERITIVDGDGTLIDDAGINISQRNPIDTITDYTISSPELTNVGTGLYDFVVALALVGDYFFEFRLTSGQSWMVYIHVTDNVNYT